MTTQQQETKQEPATLVRVGNVLEASIGTAKKRERRIGRYHVSDLLGCGVEEAARLYAGLDEEPTFPAYMSKSGLSREAMALASLPEHQKQCEVVWQDGDMQIVGHPDGVDADTAGNPVPIEVAAPMSADDEAREELKLEQVLTYAGLINNGGILSARDGRRILGKVNEVRIILAAQRDGQEIPYYEVAGEAQGRAAWLVSKAERLHMLALAHQEARSPAADKQDYQNLQAQLEQELERAREWDKRHPQQSTYEPEVIPILEGERGEEADAAVAAYAAWKDAEKEWKGKDGKGGHKARWEATLDLDTLKKVKAPGGGSITLRARKVQDVDPEVYAKMDGPNLEEQLEKAVSHLDEDLQPLRDELEKKRAGHPATAAIKELTEMIEKAREAATRTVQKPNGVLVTRPKGKKQEAGA